MVDSVIGELIHNNLLFLKSWIEFYIRVSPFDAFLKKNLNDL